MGFTLQHPIDLRVKVLAEYKAGVVGYKTLAVKYGLPRDTVRYWVLQQRAGRGLPVDTKNEKTIIDEQKDIEYYKTEAEYWKAYAKKLEAIRFPESKKKQQSKQSKNCIKKDTK
jgi:hypothetical protein